VSKFTAALPYEFRGRVIHRPLGFNCQLNRRETVAAIGDTAFSAILGWEAGEHHWNVAPTATVQSPDCLPECYGRAET
jgi:hypothetical protein